MAAQINPNPAANVKPQIGAKATTAGIAQLAQKAAALANAAPQQPQPLTPPKPPAIPKATTPPRPAPAPLRPPAVPRELQAFVAEGKRDWLRAHNRQMRTPVDAQEAAEWNVQNPNPDSQQSQLIRPLFRDLYKTPEGTRVLINQLLHSVDAGKPATGEKFASASLGNQKAASTLGALNTSRDQWGLDGFGTRQGHDTFLDGDRILTRVSQDGAETRDGNLNWLFKAAAEVAPQASVSRQNRSGSHPCSGPLLSATLGSLAKQASMPMPAVTPVPGPPVPPGAVPPPQAAPAPAPPPPAAPGAPGAPGMPPGDPAMAQGQPPTTQGGMVPPMGEPPVLPLPSNPRMTPPRQMTPGDHHQQTTMDELLAASVAKA